MASSTAAAGSIRSAGDQNGPLTGVTVIELRGERLATSLCGRVLADLGARVLVAESRLTVAHDQPEVDAYLHRGKLLVDHVGDDELGALLRSADVVIVDDFGVAEEVVGSVPEGAPPLVSITDYGFAGAPGGSEFLLQAEGGLAAMHDTESGMPVWTNAPIGETTAAAFAAATALGALIGREVPSVVAPKRYDVSVLESVLNLLAAPTMQGQIPGAGPYLQPIQMVPGVMRTLDGWVLLVAINDAHWERLRRLLAVPELDDERFDSLDRRFQHAAEVRALVAPAVATRSTATWQELGTAHSVPITAVLAPEQASAIPELRAAGFFATSSGGIHYPTAPIRRRGTPLPTQEPARRVGVAEAVGGSATGKRKAAWQVDHRSPLRGIRVADMTHYAAGPYGSCYLAALGADVIHVEAPARPDYLRMTGVDRTRDQWWERNPWWHLVDRGKRDVAIDLRVPDGQAALRRLLKSCDILIENFSARVLDDNGLDEVSLRELNPDLVVVRVPAFGLDGPWRDRPGMAFDMDALSGSAFCTGAADEPPLLSGAIFDPLTGMLAATAALAGLLRRQTGGSAATYEVPLIGAALLAMAVNGIIGQQDATVRRGNRDPAGSVRQIARSSDGRAVAASIPLRCWGAITGATDATTEGTPEEELARLIGRSPAARVVERIEEIGGRAVVVSNGTDALSHPALIRRGRVIAAAPHPVVGEIRQLGYPVAPGVSDESAVGTPAPLFGQDTRAVLSELGYDEAEIASLIERGVAADEYSPAPAPRPDRSNTHLKESAI
ncbi:CoA transferase [Nocardioides sp.]|uniref:CaiB/BaiF CoA-transferase family protein n=1 Tax=Nocardioides sp. TaxID=35761 RepID=UPI0039E4AFD7